MIDLAEINRRYDAICDMENASAQTHGAAIAYSLDVPKLIGEVRAARRVIESARAEHVAVTNFLNAYGMTIDKLVETEEGDELNAQRVHFARDYADFQS
jgi:hypothetical protein